LDGIIVVSSPQELVHLIVRKAVGMADALGVPVVGLVENMSVLTCPHCGEAIEVFGKSTAQEAAATAGLKLLGRLPIDPDLASAGDAGMIESYRGPWVDEMARWVEGVKHTS
jgi:Mrp family chromosome partitioning ATPase